MNKYIWLSIFKFLDIRTLFKLSSVCRYWNTILLDEYIWKYKASELNLISNTIDNYRQLFLDFITPINIHQFDTYRKWINTLDEYATLFLYRYPDRNVHDITVSFTYNKIKYYLYMRFPENRFYQDIPTVILIEPINNYLKFVTQSWQILKNILYRKTMCIDIIEEWEYMIAYKYLYSGSGLDRPKGKFDPNILSWRKCKLFNDKIFNRIIYSMIQYFKNNKVNISILDLNI